MPRNNPDLTLFTLTSNEFLTAIILVALFVALLFRRESIISVGLFRLGCILYIVSFVAPGVFAAAWLWIVGPYAASQTMTPGLYSILLVIVGPICLGAGLFCIISSMLPRRERRQRIASPPQKHPLD